jgi:hypothetical protein
MELTEIAERIATDDRERQQVIDIAALTLMDTVYEALRGRGIHPGSVVDGRTLKVISTLVAGSMVTQHEYEEKARAAAKAGLHA